MELPTVDYIDALKKAFLDPTFYPHPVSDIHLIETHISYVFLTGEFAYKVKKAVKFPFLDFSDLEKRRLFCHEELRLNRRCLPDIYIKVLPIHEDDGHLILGPPADTSARVRIIDYAIKVVLLRVWCKNIFFISLMAEIDEAI
jgi:aminoglycoside phosphotransferase family enzyme